MKIEHIALFVEDLEKTKQYYEKYFGAKSNNLYHNEEKGFKSYFLTFDSGSRLEIMNISNLKKANNNRTGFIHLAFSVGSVGQVNKITEDIKNAGYEVLSYPRKTGDGYYESCVTDPEGNLIEITV